MNTTNRAAGLKAMALAEMERLAADSRCCICRVRLGPDAPMGLPCRDPRDGRPDEVPYPICRFCADVRKGDA